MARMTKGKVVNFFQDKGARIHFNQAPLECEDEDGKPKIVDVRYGVVQLDDLRRDLRLWETLTCSSMM